VPTLIRGDGIITTLNAIVAPGVAAGCVVAAGTIDMAITSADAVIENVGVRAIAIEDLASLEATRTKACMQMQGDGGRI